MSLHASFFACPSDFSLFFLGVEQSPVLLQAHFVYSAVVLKVAVYIFLLLGSFCPINIWTQLVFFVLPSLFPHAQSRLTYVSRILKGKGINPTVVKVYFIYF